MQISNLKKEKIKEQILAFLFSKSPQFFFTSQIAEEIARDEEFVKNLLLDLKKKKFVVEVRKNSFGVDYLRRSRWKLSDAVYETYKKYQSNKL
jgi:predicted transcriptional regulator with HTH domain